MKVTKILYRKKFPYAPFLNEDIGFEAEVEDGECMKDVIQYLRETAEDSFKKAYPQVILQTPVEEVLTKEEIKANNIKAIMDCKTLEELTTYKLLKNDKDIFHAYNVKEKELCNK